MVEMYPDEPVTTQVVPPRAIPQIVPVVRLVKEIVVQDAPSSLEDSIVPNPPTNMNSLTPSTFEAV